MADGEDRLGHFADERLAGTPEEAEAERVESEKFGVEFRALANAWIWCVPEDCVTLDTLKKATQGRPLHHHSPDQPADRSPRGFGGSLRVPEPFRMGRRGGDPLDRFARRQGHPPNRRHAISMIVLGGY